jgi:hypothetical protein
MTTQLAVSFHLRNIKSSSTCTLHFNRKSYPQGRGKIISRAARLTLLLRSPVLLEGLNTVVLKQSPKTHPPPPRPAAAKTVTSPCIPFRIFTFTSQHSMDLCRLLRRFFVGRALSFKRGPEPAQSWGQCQFRSTPGAWAGLGWWGTRPPAAPGCSVAQVEFVKANFETGFSLYRQVEGGGPEEEATTRGVSFFVSFETLVLTVRVYLFPENVCSKTTHS